MAAIAPDPTETSAPGWLASFVQDWEPGSGDQVEDREPATGRLIATVRGSTLDDVGRAAAAAKFCSWCILLRWAPVSRWVQVPSSGRWAS